MIKYCARPYSSVEEMTEKLIEEWNTRVMPHHHVIYLGDFSLHTDALPIVSRLNGQKVLVAGNHDRCFSGHKGYKKWTQKYLEAGFSEVHFQPVHRVYEKIEFLAWHFPYRPAENDPINTDLRYLEWRPKNEGKWLLHGHVHGRWKKRNNMIDVGVDAWDMRPVSWEEIKLLMEDPRELVEQESAKGISFSASLSKPQEIVL